MSRGILRPVLPDLSAEMIREIGAQVPDYSRPLEGEFGVTLRYGVERALRRFVDSIEHPERVSARDRTTYVELGRGEMRQGRTLNALLAAYRVGAQVSWRRFVEAGVAAGLEPAVLYRVGEAIFAYIDEISGESIEGYAAEQSALAGEDQQRRAQLVRLLASDPPAPPDALRAAAERAYWTPPARVAALVIEGVEARSDRRPARAGRGRRGARAGRGPRRGGAPAAGAGVPPRPRRSRPARAPREGRRARGTRRSARRSSSRPARAARTARAARSSSSMRGRSRRRARRRGRADRDAAAARRRAARGGAGGGAPGAAGRAAPRGRASASSRRCASGWTHQGRVDDTARALGVHPQTVRYRLAQLRETFGAALDDADGRFELALALRVHAASSASATRDPETRGVSNNSP